MLKKHNAKKKLIYASLAITAILVIVIFLLHPTPICPRCVRLSSNTTHEKEKPQKAFSDLVDKLDKLGYYQYTAPAKLAKTKAECKKAGYIYGWNNTKRDYFADAEELTEAGVVNFIIAVKPFLKLQGVNIDSVKHNYPDIKSFDCLTYEEQLKLIPKKYIVTVNGKEFIIWTQKEVDNKKLDIWQLSTERTLGIINYFLKKANSKERAFQLYEGNEQIIIFLTNEMAKLIYASKYIAPNDKPIMTFR